MDCDEAAARVPGAPRSTRTILCTLIARGPMTMQALQEASGLARRTVYGAIRQLLEGGFVQGRTSLQDARQTLFWFKG